MAKKGGQIKEEAVKKPRRGFLARPLDALVFLLPLLVFYEVEAAGSSERLIASVLLRGFFELFGDVGMYAPGLAVVVILLTTHIFSGERWKVHWGHVGWMYVEAVVLAGPVLALNWAIPLGPEPVVGSELVDKIALGVGAGVYEELVFRLVLITVVMIVGVDMFGARRGSVAVAAVLISALIFSAHHHRPVGMEEFALMPFIFRSLAGVYLAIVFWLRGYASAAGCHAAFNVAIVLLTMNGKGGVG